MLAYRSFEEESCASEEIGLGFDLAVVSGSLVDVAISGGRE